MLAGGRGLFLANYLHRFARLGALLVNAAPFDLEPSRMIPGGAVLLLERLRLPARVSANLR